MSPTTITTAASWYVRIYRAVIETLQSLRDEWLGWIAVILLALAFANLVFAALHYFFPICDVASGTTAGARVVRTVLGANFIGSLWVLVGTLWSILGVFIPASQLAQLRSWEAQRTVPTREVLRALRVASNFGKSGATFIMFGSSLLLAQMFVPAAG